MDDCRAFQEGMLEADPEELSGSADTPLAVHIPTCPECRALAQQFLTAQTALRDVVVGQQPARTIDAAPAAGRSPLRRWAWAPLVAAAALIAWMAPRINDAPSPDVRPIANPVIGPTHPLTVASDQDVVVMNTKNPNITVVWFH